ncbi:MAG TPA: isochorismatase family cysteine hydrolase [Rhizobiaceae bacterium]|nr:isochorismatase family cysteine hydrolase [Rhizobiaceae bacterium]
MSEPEILLTPQARLDRAHSAIVVIDMQNDFCAEGGYVEKVVGRSAAACRAVVEPVVELVQAAREKGVPVFWVRAIYDPEKLPAGIRAKQRARSDAICCATGSWGADFFGVAPDGAECVIDKHSYSAFIGTSFDAILRKRGVRTLIFAGVQTNVCVESSLRDAACMGYYAVLPSDCVASHAEPLHEATLKNVEFLFGDVMSRAEIVSIWDAD